MQSSTFITAIIMALASYAVAAPTPEVEIADDIVSLLSTILPFGVIPPHTLRLALCPPPSSRPILLTLCLTAMHRLLRC